MPEYGRFFRYKYKHGRQHTYRCFALWHIHSPELVHKPFAFYVASPNPLLCLVNLPFSGNFGSVTRALIHLRTVSERRKHRSAALQKLQHLPAPSASSRNMLRNAPDRWPRPELDASKQIASFDQWTVHSAPVPESIFLTLVDTSIHRTGLNMCIIDVS